MNARRLPASTGGSFVWGASAFWAEAFPASTRQAVSTVNVAGGRGGFEQPADAKLTPARRAKQRFLNSYPMLGALASAFAIIEDPAICRRLEISIATVDFETEEIFMNTAAGLDEDEACFVMAHELLHVGLRHDVRRRGRDPYLWNIACDYVINGWLVEMSLGTLPRLGVIYVQNSKVSLRKPCMIWRSRISVASANWRPCEATKPAT